MKKFASVTIAAVMLSASPFAMAKSLNGYKEVLAEMKTGKPVYALVDVSKCTHKQQSGSHDVESNTIGIRMDHLYVLTKARTSDGKRMREIGFAQHNWGGVDNYYLSRTLIHVWQDNVVEVLNDTVDPTTFKLKDRDVWLCKPGKDGGVTFSSH